MARNIGFIVASLVLLGSLSACGNDDSASSNKKVISRVVTEESPFKATELESTVDGLIAAISETEPKSLQLNLNLKALTGYWEPVVVGANRAMGELDVGGAVEAPDTTSLGENPTSDQVTQVQVDMMKDARAKGADGFGISAITDVLAAEIDAATAAGLPVVTIDSDLATSSRDVYIGTINAEAGKTAGNSLKALLPAAPGTVIILGYELENWPDGYDRTMATKDTLEAAGYTTVVRRTLWSATGEAEDVQFMADTISTADPPVVGMVGMFSNAYRCAMAAEAAGKTGSDIAIAAFDFDPKTVAYMQSGLIKVTHAQRQYYMGYLTPYILYGIDVLGKDKTKRLLASQMVDDYRFDAGLDVVSANQLDSYYTFLDQLGISGS